MPYTPDSFPGERSEEAVIFEAGDIHPTQNGEVRYVTGEGFRFYEDGTEIGLGGAGITEAAHKALRQLVHLADGGGPFEGFASGAYREVTGTVFPTAIVWYDSSGVGKKKIVEKLIAYSGAFPSTITWKMYDETETLLVTVVDTFSYSGAFETSRTRTIS